MGIEFLLNLQKGMADGRVSVRESLQMAYSLLSKGVSPAMIFMSQ